MAKSRKIPVDGSAETAENTLLGDLLRERGLAPEKEPVKEIPRKDPEAAASQIPLHDLSKAGKMVLRVQRKGMGGKTVTVLTCQEFAQKLLEPLAKELRKGLGCGSRVEMADIILQGDVAERAARWLGARGAKRIVGGS